MLCGFEGPAPVFSTLGYGYLRVGSPRRCRILLGVRALRVRAAVEGFGLWRKGVVSSTRA